MGSFSLLNCVAGAYVERVPLVIISASPSAQDRRATRQEGILFHHSTGNLQADQLVFQHVTVASAIIGSGTDAPEQIDHVMVELLTHRRPIYLEVCQLVLPSKPE